MKGQFKFKTNTLTFSTCYYMCLFNIVNPHYHKQEITIMGTYISQVMHTQRLGRYIDIPAFLIVIINNDPSFVRL